MADEPQARADRLADAVAEAKRQWPGLAIDDEDFRVFMAEKEATTDAPSELRAGDLYLAYGCAAGLPAALVAFEDRYLARVTDAVHRRAGGALMKGELAQLLRERLFVEPGPGRRPKIAEYGGRGPLEAWLKVVALRVALNAERGAVQARETSEGAEDAIAEGNPERQLVRLTSQTVFREAFREALAALPARDRRVLRQHYVDGLTVEQLATMHGVDRRTVLRWTARGREQLALETRRLLETRLRVPAREIESLLRDAQSAIDLSLGALLGATSAKASRDER